MTIAKDFEIVLTKRERAVLRRSLTPTCRNLSEGFDKLEDNEEFEELAEEVERLRLTVVLLSLTFGSGPMLLPRAGIRGLTFLLREWRNSAICCALYEDDGEQDFIDKDKEEAAVLHKVLKQIKSQATVEDMVTAL
jgi:hypothetical protein